MDDPCLIRLAEVSDISDIVAIEKRVFSTPWPGVSFHSFLGPCFLVLERDGIVVAYGVGRVAAEEGEVLNLAVDPRHRRKGFGGRLLFTLVSRLADNGAEVVYLEVRESNQAAIGLYRHFGFHQVGRRTAYYADPIEDALVFRLEIDGVTGVTKKGSKSRIFD